MSSELERRLEAVFAEAPDPDPGAGEKALHRALRALQPAAPARRGVRTAVLAFAAAVVLLVIAAGSLAAAGALHISIGTKPKPRPTTQLVLPNGANGIAAIVGGRLSVATKDGLGLQGRPVSAAALSPRALYVAAGSGNSLVALAPNGRVAWSHPAGGKIVSIAWAPDGFRIAYVVQTGRHFVLHLIYGNGIHDTVVDRSVRAVRPSWRADSLALAYVGGGGRAIVYDLGHQQHQVVPVGPPVTGVAFAPAGRALAVEGAHGLSLVHGSSRREITHSQVEAFGWLNGRLAVVTPELDSAVIRLFSSNGASRGSAPASGIVVAVTPRFAVVRRGQKLFAGHTAVLTTPRGVTVHDLQLG